MLKYTRQFLALALAAVTSQAPAATSFSWLNPETPVANILTSAIVEGNALYTNVPLLFKQGYSQIPLNFLLSGGEHGSFANARELFDYLRFVATRNQVYLYTTSSGKINIPTKDLEKNYWDEVKTSCTSHPENWLVNWTLVDAALNSQVGAGKITPKQKFDTLNDLNYLEFKLQLTCAIAQSGMRAGTFGVWQIFNSWTLQDYSRPLAETIKKSSEPDEGLKPILSFADYKKAMRAFSESEVRNRKIRSEKYGNYAQTVETAYARINATVFGQEKPLQLQKDLLTKYTAKNRLSSLGISIPPLESINQQ